MKFKNIHPSLEIVEQVRKTAKITYPYIPGLLTFREGPVLERCFQALKTEPTEPKKTVGAFSYLLDKRGNKIGAVLRTRDNVKPVYVSPGQNIDLASSIRIVLMCIRRFRLPQPLRLAHQLTNQR